MRNILHDLYFGRIAGWERRPVRTTEENNINKRIHDEKRYFTENMSEDDRERIEALEDLYTQAHEFDVVDAYCHGLRFGVTLMCQVVIGDDDFRKSPKKDDMCKCGRRSCSSTSKS